MDNTRGNTKWRDHVGKSEPRPRIMFEDHMAVFSVSGSRPQIFPDRQQSDGFDRMDHHLYIATPEELDPKNHEALKKTLLEKIDEAKALPFSKNHIESIKEGYISRVIAGALIDEPEMAIRHFSKTSKTVRQDYGTAEALKEVAADSASGHFAPYTLLNKIRGDESEAADARIYHILKELYKKAGKEQDFAYIEQSIAENTAEYILGHLPFEHEEHQRLLKGILKVGTSESGSLKLSINKSAVERIHTMMLERTYADVDAVINKARENFVERSQKSDIEKPFEYTDEEKLKIQEIHEIAHKEHPYKPVILAGYANPDLAMIITDYPTGTWLGVSYGDLGLIQIASKAKGYPFSDTLVEELLHQGMENIYHNDSLPYQRENDSRKALITKVLEHDFADIYSGLHFGFGNVTGYKIASERVRHQELPVKFMKYSGSEAMDSIKELAGTGAFSQLGAYAKEVILKDAIAYHAGLPLAEIAEDYSRRLTNSLQVESQPRGRSHEP